MTGHDDICSHGRPNHQDLIAELRQAIGLPGPPLPITPRQAWGEAVDAVHALAKGWLEIADSIRIEAEVSSRFGQYERLNDLADRVDALSKPRGVS